MKIFDQTEAFPGKVNFVDENNVCLGYDLQQDCYEQADWFISDKEVEINYDDDDVDKFRFDVEDYVFDPTYFKQVNCSGLDEGGMVRFRLVNGNNELFIHIYNSHNGYYGHGFEFKIGDEIKHDGTL